MKNMQMKPQKIASCVTPTRWAHLTKKTNVQSPGTDIHKLGAHLVVSREAREAALMGRPNHRVGRPHVGGIRPHLWREDRPYPPQGGVQCFHI